MTARIVAIDGPAGAGKSSASRGLAARLGFAPPAHAAGVSPFRRPRQQGLLFGDGG